MHALMSNRANNFKLRFIAYVIVATDLFSEQISDYYYLLEMLAHAEFSEVRQALTRSFLGF